MPLMLTPPSALPKASQGSPPIDLGNDLRLRSPDNWQLVADNPALSPGSTRLSVRHSTPLPCSAFDNYTHGTWSVGTSLPLYITAAPLPSSLRTNMNCP
jgi:hypothetical protein